MSADDHALHVLLHCLHGLDEDDVVTADTARDAWQAAQATSPERSGALQAAIHRGYLRRVLVLIPGIADYRGGGTDLTHVCIPSKHEAGKGRPVVVYRRTDKPIPEHVCEIPA